MILLFYVLSLHEFSSWSKLVGIRQESMMRGWKQSYLQLPQKRWCFFKVLRSETGKHSGTTVGLFIPGKIHIYGKRQDKSTANSQLCRAHRMGRGGGRTGCRGVHLCACCSSPCCKPSSSGLLQTAACLPGVLRAWVTTAKSLSGGRENEKKIAALK